MKKDGENKGEKNGIFYRNIRFFVRKKKKKKQ